MWFDYDNLVYACIDDGRHTPGEFMVIMARRLAQIGLDCPRDFCYNVDNKGLYRVLGDVTYKNSKRHCVQFKTERALSMAKLLLKD